MVQRSKSEYLNFIDTELRVLICTAVCGPLPRADLSKRTGIRKGNLTGVVEGLLLRGHLKSQTPPQTSDRSAGRPSKEYLALAYPQKLYDIIIELEYRRQKYEREIDEHTASRDKAIEKIRNAEKVDDSIYNEFAQILKRRLIVVSGTPDTLTEISYPSVRYWLSELREKAKTENIPQSEVQECNRLLNAPTPKRPMPLSTSLSKMKNIELRFNSKRTNQVRKNNTKDDGTVQYNSDGSFWQIVSPEHGH